ncbi:hypothetical protein [Streptomyces sp. NPDC051286]|uniref:hypothetical protein n=1 Tax=Streptomyces sp. NPDC051286 TaxID=3365647 RepID=UPI0037905C5E
MERVCDYLVVLAGSRIQLAGDVSELLASHYRIVGTRDVVAALPAAVEPVSVDHTLRESTAIVHAANGLPASGPWTVEALDLEELVLAYMARANQSAAQPFPMPTEAHR